LPSSPVADGKVAVLLPVPEKVATVSVPNVADVEL
jgi:hypothetical protein